MGIKLLMHLINDKSPKAVKKTKFSNYYNKPLAIDASMAIYQCLMGVQKGSNMLTDESGNLTGHLIGIFNRTIKYIEDGIKPIWVFDGIAPEMKTKELQRRKEIKSIAREKIISEQFPIPESPEKNIEKEKKEISELVEKKEKKNKSDDPKKKKKITKFQIQAIQKKQYGAELEEIEISLRNRISGLIGMVLTEITGNDYLCLGESDQEDFGVTKELEQILNSIEKNPAISQCPSKMEEVHKNMKKTTQITSDMLDDVKEMLIHLGVPVVESPSEAEAQCAELVKSGKAYAVITEDMDSLAFGAPHMLKNCHSKEDMVEISLSEVLLGLDFSYEEFVDLCILLGCDYSKTISGIGAVRAYKLMRKCLTIEKVIETLRLSTKQKYTLPEDFNFNEARKIFMKPKVINSATIDFVWNPPNEDKLKEFLIAQKGFSVGRVENGLKRLKKTHIGNQPKIENFLLLPFKRSKNENEEVTEKKKKVQEDKMKLFNFI